MTVEWSGLLVSHGEEMREVSTDDSAETGMILAVLAAEFVPFDEDDMVFEDERMINWTIGTEAPTVDEFATGADDEEKKRKVLPLTAGRCASITCWAGTLVRLRTDWPTAATEGNCTS